MRKIIGLLIFMAISFSLVGCDSTADTKEAVDKVTEIVEQPADIEEDETSDVLTLDNKEFNHYMTTNMSDKEYAEYFSDDKIGQEIEFDGNIVSVQMKEGYNTRAEVLLTSGDYSEKEINGPYIKDCDIAISDLDGMIDKGHNVRVKAKLYNYNIEDGCLEINIKSIESR